MTVKMAAPSTRGNQPPCQNLSEHDTTSSASSASSAAVAASATGSG